ncbi:DinB family protein [Nocardioides sp. GY 10127]|uniref:DinB family protein n=1 Tax=Nocardioides sp. GY 10127 TaxID=2569762 RepID=UPI0010A90393|nr:DinB family protein [Nocardioides sp. GY 10127]TIC85564.1 DinB family protein [Nocardioides sp. GY 10127]
MTSQTQPAVQPAVQPATADTKDWTWVLEQPCPDCGFVPGAVGRADVGRTLRAQLPLWRSVLAGEQAAVRPEPGTWSATEYACHVRDVQRVFAGRVAAVAAAADAPALFENWDQDATALEERYDLSAPGDALAGLETATEAVADLYDSLDAGDDGLWARRGLRSNGSAFTLDTLAQYHLHDVLHHAWDVRPTA